MPLFELSAELTISVSPPPAQAGLAFHDRQVPGEPIWPGPAQVVSVTARVATPGRTVSRTAGASRRSQHRYVLALRQNQRPRVLRPCPCCTRSFLPSRYITVTFPVSLDICPMLP